jgi:hypothetical protein
MENNGCEDWVTGNDLVDTVVRRILNLRPHSSASRVKKQGVEILFFEIGEKDLEDDDNESFGEEPTVVVTPGAMQLRLPTVIWSKGAYDPIPASRFWKRVATDGLDDAALAEWFNKAKQARQKEFRACRFCGKKFPPEHRDDRNTCHGCAEKHLGVVY